MSDDVSGTLRARRRARALWFTLGATVVAAVVAVIVISATHALPGDDGAEGADPSPTPSVTTTPAPAAGATATGELEPSEAVDVLDAALAVSLSGIGTSDDLAEILKNIASDAYAAELEAQWQELVSQGWSVQGTASVISAEFVELDADRAPAVATVSACVDSSDVTVLDSEDAPVGDPAARMPRSTHIFTLAQDDDGLWRITSHSFPNDPTC